MALIVQKYGGTSVGNVERIKNAARRVAKTAVQQERKYAKEQKPLENLEEKFYDAIASLKFIPGGRILANAGTNNKMLYSSFVIMIPDSMKGIFKALLEKALIQRLGSGIGFSFSRLRQKGIRIMTININVKTIVIMITIAIARLDIV